MHAPGGARVGLDQRARQLVVTAVQAAEGRGAIYQCRRHLMVSKSRAPGGAHVSQRQRLREVHRGGGAGC